MVWTDICTYNKVILMRIFCLLRHGTLKDAYKWTGAQTTVNAIGCEFDSY